MIRFEILVALFYNDGSIWITAYRDAHRNCLASSCAPPRVFPL